MRVLVSGSEGFLGKHVCAALKEWGHTVIGLDTVAGADIVADITKVIPIMQVDAVVHLAAVASPNVCTAAPAQAFNVNVQGTSQVLRLAMESGARKFVFSSSAHVYGISPKYLPTDETHPLWLQNVYTTTKILGEQLCQLYHDNHGLSFTTLRLFNAYGPGQGSGYFVPDMIKKAKSGHIDLSGGETTKDWVHVSDVARAFAYAVETAFVGPINIGTGVETPLSTVARAITAFAGATLTVLPTPAYTRMQADWTRAYKVLNWEPTITLEEGLHGLLGDTLKARAVFTK